MDLRRRGCVGARGVPSWCSTWCSVATTSGHRPRRHGRPGDRRASHRDDVRPRAADADRSATTRSAPRPRSSRTDAAALKQAGERQTAKQVKALIAAIDDAREALANQQDTTEPFAELRRGHRPTFPADALSRHARLALPGSRVLRMIEAMADRERPELGPRKSAVLRAVVEQYVRTGEPVSSESIAEHAGLGVSSATIRNEMAALEELSYLTHPHTSAGRIPTDTGYRHYVDSAARGRAPARGAAPPDRRLLRRGDRRPRGSAHGKRAAALAAHAVRGARGAAERGRGADRARRADRHGADPDDPGGRPARTRRQAGDRQARRASTRRRCATPTVD